MSKYEKKTEKKQGWQILYQKSVDDGVFLISGGNFNPYVPQAGHLKMNVNLENAQTSVTVTGGKTNDMNNTLGKHTFAVNWTGKIDNMRLLEKEKPKTHNGTVIINGKKQEVAYAKLFFDPEDQHFELSVFYPTMPGYYFCMIGSMKNHNGKTIDLTKGEPSTHTGRHWELCYVASNHSYIFRRWGNGSQNCDRGTAFVSVNPKTHECRMVIKDGLVNIEQKDGSKKPFAFEVNWSGKVDEYKEP